MKKYKVMIELTSNYDIDVLADNEEQAQQLAQQKFSALRSAGMEHNHENGDTEWNTTEIFDVTNTDDPFNP